MWSPLSRRALCPTPRRGSRKPCGALGDLPPFPAILTRLIASLSGDDISFSKLGDLIEKDVIIAGNLLHLVNSALYARRGEINSVRHALSLLGIDKVRNATLGMSITRMWGKVGMPGGWSMARFNMHSSDMAILSDLLAQRVPVDYPEGAFVAGLLHDIGRMLIARALPAEQERILSMYASGVLYLDCEREVLGWTHAETFPPRRLAIGNYPARSPPPYGITTLRAWINPPRSL